MEEFTKAVDTYNDFAIKITKKTLTKNGSEFFSPYSLCNALTIVGNGANDDTKRLIQSGIGMTIKDLNTFFNDINSTTYNFETTNAIWFNTNVIGNINNDYRKRVNEYFASAVQTADFSDGSDEIADKINKWVSERTNGRITHAIDEADINEDAPFIIVNTVLGGSDWMIGFEKDVTYSEGFTNADGSSGTVEMMHNVVESYWELEDAVGVVKYGDNGSAFVVVMPDEDINIYDYIDIFDGNVFQRMVDSEVLFDNFVNESFKEGDMYYEGTADRHHTVLSMPKMDAKCSFDLTESLKKFGLSEIFDADIADFSEMGSGPLCVNDVRQNSTIYVDEEKYEVSASTEMPGGMGFVTPNIKYTEYYHYVELNRPFIYAVLDNRGIILFTGVYTGAEEDTSAIKLEVTADKIKVRSGASTSNDQYRIGWEEYSKGLVVKKGDILYAGEKKEAGGYTWYRIGQKAWIADKNGEWISEIK